MQNVLSLRYSRKFWIAVADCVSGLALYFVGKYVPAAAEDLQTTWIALQPVLVILIAGIAAEDFAEKHTGK